MLKVVVNVVVETRQKDCVETLKMADHSLFLTQAPPPDPIVPQPAAAAARQPAPPPTLTPGARTSPIIVDAPPKRARFDPSVEPGKPNRSPMALAEELIKSHISTLHEGIATLLLNRGREHIVLSQRLFSKERSKLRIEKDDLYIPVSARVSFRLQVVKEAEELENEYKLLQDKSAEIIKRHQEELKVICVDSINLDIKAIRAARNRHYCTSLYQVASIFHIAQGLDVDHTHHTVMAILKESSDVLLKHTGIPANEFLGLYMTALKVPVLAPTTQDGISTASTGEIKRALESVFVLSWDKFLATSRENQLSLSLKKEAKAALKTEKSDDAANLLLQEVPADRTQLQELIRKEAAILVKSMMKKEASNQVQRKNGHEGPSGASHKKKSPGRNPGKNSKSKDKTKDINQSSRTRQRTNQRGRKAAANNRDLQPDKGNKGRNRSKSRSTQRQTGSDNRNSRS